MPTVLIDKVPIQEDDDVHCTFVFLICSLACNQHSDATPEEIKKAYYNCMKECHPDLSGDDPETTNFCMFINEIYEVSSALWVPSKYWVNS